MSTIPYVPDGLFDDEDDIYEEPKAGTSIYDDSDVPQIDKNKGTISKSQWTEIKPNVYVCVPRTVKPLPVGVYSHTVETSGIAYHREFIEFDSLVELPDSSAEELLKEINTFFAESEKYKERGLLHKRGYLLHGSQGTGKTSLVYRIMKRVSELGGVSFILKCHPSTFSNALVEFRGAEPDRLVLCFYEDLESILEDSEKELLALLDGDRQIQHVIHIATTNFFDKLDDRIIKRPRRFDRVVKYDMPPNKQMRETFLRKKVLSGNFDFDLLTNMTEGMTIAALSEFVISIDCLGNSVEETLERLKPQQKGAGFR